MMIRLLITAASLIASPAFADTFVTVPPSGSMKERVLTAPPADGQPYAATVDASGAITWTLLDPSATQPDGDTDPTNELYDDTALSAAAAANAAAIAAIGPHPTFAGDLVYDPAANTVSYTDAPNLDNDPTNELYDDTAVTAATAANAAAIAAWVDTYIEAVGPDINGCYSFIPAGGGAATGPFCPGAHTVDTDTVSDPTDGTYDFSAVTDADGNITVTAPGGTTFVISADDDTELEAIVASNVAAIAAWVDNDTVSPLPSSGVYDFTSVTNPDGSITITAPGGASVFIPSGGEIPNNELVSNIGYNFDTLTGALTLSVTDGTGEDEVTQVVTIPLVNPAPANALSLTGVGLTALDNQKITTADTSLIFTSSGLPDNDYTAQVRVSNVDGNALVLTASGLYVEDTDSQKLSSPTGTVIVSTTNSPDYDLTADVNVSTASDNQLTVAAGGALYVAPTTAADIVSTNPENGICVDPIHGTLLTGTIQIIEFDNSGTLSIPNPPTADQLACGQDLYTINDNGDWFRYDAVAGAWSLETVSAGGNIRVITQGAFSMDEAALLAGVGAGAVNQVCTSRTLVNTDDVPWMYNAWIRATPAVNALQNGGSVAISLVDGPTDTAFWDGSPIYRVTNAGPANPLQLGSAGYIRADSAGKLAPGASITFEKCLAVSVIGLMDTANDLQGAEGQINGSIMYWRVAA